MNRKSTFEELLLVAGRAGIQVRHIPLGGSGGGLASVRGKPCLFVDVDAEPDDQLERTLDALMSVPAVQTQTLRADVHHLLEQRKARLSG